MNKRAPRPGVMVRELLFVKFSDSTTFVPTYFRCQETWLIASFVVSKDKQVLATSKEKLFQTNQNK